MNDPTYRILDASLNRAAEGLRTMEEYARFVADDPAMTLALKQLRHDLAAAMECIPREKLLLARDTPGDVGTQIATASEQNRASVASVLSAAIARTQQALRSIEEYAKTTDHVIAPEIEAIRYRVYDLGKQVELSQLSGSRDPGKRRRARLQTAYLYALVDAGDSAKSFQSHVCSILDGGVDIFQLRDRGVDDRTLYQRSCLASHIARDKDALFIVNDRADIAVAADADGVHVGQEELPAAAARRVIGRDRLLGISTHDIDQALTAAGDGADCIGCGPVFAGRTKTFDQYVGTTFIRQIREADVGIPAFAIGGIDSANVGQVIAAGCRRIAVTAALRHGDDPAAAASELKRMLRG